MALGGCTHLPPDQGGAQPGRRDTGTEVNPATIEAGILVGVDLIAQFPRALDRGDRPGSRRGHRHDPPGEAWAGSREALCGSGSKAAMH
jgi:hypothetical protein